MPVLEQPGGERDADAAVVIGDCYNLDMRTNQLLNRAGETVGTESCLIPPVPRKLYGSDAHLPLNLSVCPSKVAPWHVHDPQPAALAAMLQDHAAAPHVDLCVVGADHGLLDALARELQRERARRGRRALRRLLTLTQTLTLALTLALTLSLIHI